jgi:hypothetical protein
MPTGESQKVILKKKIRFLLIKILPRNFSTKILFLGPKRYILYFIAQRVLRINSHVTWPVHWSSIVSHPNKIKKALQLPYLGHHPGCYIQAMNGIEIGKNVRYGPNVHIISSNHSLLDYDKHDHTSPIKIGDNCWIGSGAIILPGVELSDHVIVAAGSVVTKSFTNDKLIGGVPAKVIKRLDPYTGNPNWGNYNE